MNNPRSIPIANRLRIGRRSLLAGALATGAGQLLLRPLLAEAQGITSPRRLLLIHRPCGSWPGNWFPKQPGPLDTLSPLLESFAAVKSKMLVMKGVDTGADHGVNGDKHAMGAITMLCGGMPVQPAGTSQADLDDGDSKTIVAPAPSLDQYLLQNDPTMQLAAARTPSIQLAGTTRSAQGAGFTCLRVISHSGKNQPMFGEARSDVAFNTHLGSVMVGGEDAAAIAKAQAQGKSVLDFVHGDLDRLRAQVPGSQYAKLDAHLEAIRQLEKQVTTPIGGECMKPTLLEQPRQGGLPDAEPDEIEHQALSRNMLSILKASFQCDVTRVASLTFADGNNNMRPKMYVPNSTFQMSVDHHLVSHAGSEGDAVAAKTQTDKFYGDMVGQFLAEMDQIPEGDPALGETLLDHTLVIYFSECSIGDDHNPKNMPLALFGGKFLNMNRGQFVEYSPSIYVNDVWTSLLNAWGLELERYGDPKWCKSSGPQAAKGLFG
jgi:hypothetical protein